MSDTLGRQLTQQRLPEIVGTVVQVVSFSRKAHTSYGQRLTECLGPQRQGV